MVNRTTIPELAVIIKESKCLISVDTGTMHLGYAVSAPVAAIFYRPETINLWAPDKKLYKSEIIKENFTAQHIFDKACELINFNS